MEDTLSVDIGNQEGFGFFAVFDGHGGALVAERAAKEYKNFLFNNQNFREGKYREALTDSFIEFDNHLRKTKAENVSVMQSGPVYMRRDDPGACALVALITPKNEIFVANAGDCVALLAKSSETMGGLVPISMSESHTANVESEQKRINSAGGQVKNGRVNDDLIPSRGFGDFGLKNLKLAPKDQMISCVPDVTCLSLQKQDVFLLISTDGIWEGESKEIICDFIEYVKKKDNKYDNCLERVFAECQSDSHFDICGLDNMAAILVEFKH